MDCTHFVAVRLPDMNKAKLLASGGYMTSKRVHACRFDKETAERVSAEIMEQDPTTKAWAKPFPRIKAR